MVEPADDVSCLALAEQWTPKRTNDLSETVGEIYQYDSKER